MRQRGMKLQGDSVNERRNRGERSSYRPQLTATTMVLMFRREAARRMEPPKVSRRPSAQNVAAAAAQLPSRSHAAPARPPENDRPSKWSSNLASQS